ncbi:glucose dehydrogenase (acceptor)-like protein 3, partial [Leptotrombidium deliense]
VSVISNLPVGDNLHDHVFAAGIDFRVNRKDIPSLKRSLSFTDSNILQYISSKDGPLTSFGGIEAIAFVNTKYVNISLDWPDVQLVLVNGNMNDNHFDLLEHILDDMNQTDSKKLFSILPVLLRPNSRGSVKLRSTNPYDKPIIDPKYLTHPEDIMTMVAAMKIALAVGTSVPFKDIGSRLILPLLE